MNTVKSLFDNKDNNSTLLKGLEIKKQPSIENVLKKIFGDQYKPPISIKFIMEASLHKS